MSISFWVLFIFKGYYIYGRNCRSGGDPLQDMGFVYDYTIPPSDDVESSSGSETDVNKIEMSKYVRVPIKVDTATIGSNPYVFEGDMDSAMPSASVEFCVVFYLTTLDGSMEIAAQETVVNLDIDFSDLIDDFYVRAFKVDPKDRITKEDSRAFTNVAYLCNPLDGSDMTAIVAANPPFTQGQSIDICIKPDDNALSEGVRMRSINSLTFTHATTGVSQTAIDNGLEASNGGSYFDSDDCFESELCSVSTLLFSNFFKSPGIVSASGDVTMAFPTSSERDRERNRNRELERERERDRDRDRDRQRQRQRQRQRRRQLRSCFCFSCQKSFSLLCSLCYCF